MTGTDVSSVGESDRGNTGRLYEYFFADLTGHLRQRQKLEMQIIRELLEGYAVLLPAKKYTDEDLRKKFH